MDADPVEKINVFLVPRDTKKNLTRVEAVTDRNGVANFENVKPGRYYIEASRLGIEVGPGTVIVAKEGSQDQIEIQWPLRTKYSTTIVSGRLQHQLVTKQNPVQDLVHPRVVLLAMATLTLSNIHSGNKVAAITTGPNGDFAFPNVVAGNYLLRVQEKPDAALAHPLDDYLVIHVDPSSSRTALNLQLDWTSCGMRAEEIRNVQH